MKSFRISAIAIATIVFLVSDARCVDKIVTDQQISYMCMTEISYVAFTDACTLIKVI